MTCAAASLLSISRIRPSMKPCLSLAASYSAFSDRSPWARASLIAWITACRSTDLRRASSSFSFSAPRRVSGIVAISGTSGTKTKPPRRHPAAALVAGSLVQFGVQFLQRHYAQVVAVLHAFHRRFAAGHAGVVGHPLRQRRLADVARIGDRGARLVDGR